MYSNVRIDGVLIKYRPMGQKIRVTTIAGSEIENLISTNAPWPPLR